MVNCHLQAGKQGGRRVRQTLEAVTTAYKAAKNKFKGRRLARVRSNAMTMCNYYLTSVFSCCGIESDPENLKLIVCGDFNGGEESGAVQLLETGSIGPEFLEDGERVASKLKTIPIPAMIDVAKAVDRGGASPPSTLVVPELISIMIDKGTAETAYIDPQFSTAVLDRLRRIYNRFATVAGPDTPTIQSQMQMGKTDVEKWLEVINLRVGRGTEFRNAAKFMGWVDPTLESDESGSEPITVNKEERPPIIIPDDGILTFDDFLAVYLDELRQGKFWGIAWDLAALDEPLHVTDVFKARYDRMYCSPSLVPVTVLDTTSDVACPNVDEPSDHLPVCASFVQKEIARGASRMTQGA